LGGVDTLLAPQDANLIRIRSIRPPTSQLPPAIKRLGQQG